MMDTQRLIALVVFSFSALLLWDAWQKHNAPRLVPPSTSVPSASAPDVVAPRAPTAAVTSGAPTPAVPAAAPTPATVGEPIVVKTDLFDVELNTLGGDIRRVTMKQQHSALDRTKPLTLLEPDSRHYFVAQSGLLGEGLPTHQTSYEADARTYALADGRDQMEVTLRSRDARDAVVTKRYTFHRGSYVIDVSYDVKNAAGHAISPVAYFQFHWKLKMDGLAFLPIINKGEHK